MQKSDNMPLWVFLAFSSIETRKAALMLIWGSIIFSAYCIPWPILFPGIKWVASIFLIDDWSWLAMMLPMTIWYWLSMKWVDKNASWAQTA